MISCFVGYSSALYSPGIVVSFFFHWYTRLSFRFRPCLFLFISSYLFIVRILSWLHYALLLWLYIYSIRNKNHSKFPATRTMLLFRIDIIFSIIALRQLYGRSKLNLLTPLEASSAGNHPPTSNRHSLFLKYYI